VRATPVYFDDDPLEGGCEDDWDDCDGWDDCGGW
jgi:hypothetical protein